MTGRVVVLSTADWGADVWTNKQYVARGLAETFEVVYVESLGLRAPRPSRRDLARIADRLRRSADTPRAGRPQSAGLRVVAPTVLPFHGAAPVRAVNRKLMDRLADRIGLGPDDVLWTYSPITYGWEERAGPTVYHCVDLLHEIPGVPTRTYLRAERALVQRASRVIASSSGIVDHLGGQGAGEVLLWENVADTALFAAEQSSERLPRALFAGHVTPSKIDFACLASVLDAGVPLAVAGPITIDGSTLTPAQRAVLDRCDLLGLLSPEELAREAGRSSCGLIPYLVDRHTAGIFPMKLYEYLAAGLPVVATALPSLAGTELTGLVVTGPSSYGAEVSRAVGTFDAEGAATRSAEAAGHSWEARIADATALCRHLLGQP